MALLGHVTVGSLISSSELKFTMWRTDPLLSDLSGLRLGKQISVTRKPARSV
jgi:hypothetical protein